MDVFAPYGDNYPAMTRSEWENAPFNQCDPEPRKFDVEVCCTLTPKYSFEIETTDYEAGCVDRDEDGWHQEPDTYTGNAADDVRETYNTPVELLNKMRYICQRVLETNALDEAERLMINRAMPSLDIWADSEEEFEEA